MFLFRFAALDTPTETNRADDQLSQIMGMFTDISKDMLKSAIEKLRPEFQQMADQAVTRAVELRDKRVQELKDELSSKEKDLKQCILEKKKLKEDGQKNADVIEQKDREIKKLEREIEGVKLKLKRRESDLKKEQARSSEEEAKRVEIEKTLKEEIGKLRKELDNAKAQRGVMKAVKNLGELEIKKLKEREKELLDQLEQLKSQR